MPLSLNPDRASHGLDDEWTLLLGAAAGADKTPPAGLDDLLAAVTTPLLDLYLPLCQPNGARGSIVGHLGQSIDGYIATASGDSGFVNDQENIRHLHRLRALHDAVIVGAGTIAADDPQLTTRRVTGPNPVRVVLDPNRRLPRSCRVFDDGAAPTILIVADSAREPATHGNAEVVGIPVADGRFDLACLVDRLAARGLKRLFVEGGGRTVSSFFDAGILDRLQIAVAPILMGAGVPGLSLPAHDTIDDCPRPPHRLFRMGEDLLFDWDLAATGAARESPSLGDASHFGSVGPIQRLR